MGLAPIALALLLATPVPGPAPARARPAPASERKARSAYHAAGRAAASPLAEAKAWMRALVRDPTRRRYRHNWEKGITQLERAAKGKDAAPALLEAARARYALYRWSAIEADRDEALRLAGRASKLGSRDARALAAAIRREAGEDRPARTAVAHAERGGKPAAKAEHAERGEARHALRPPPPAEPEPTPAEEAAPDPALEQALGDLGEAARPVPLGESGGEGTARVSEVRAWSSPEYTRVAVYLSHWVGWQKRELLSDGDHPRRLALDLRPAVLDGKALAREVAGLRLDRVRAAQNDAETVRVVLDLPGKDGVQVFRLEDPPRLILDVGPAPSRPPEPAGTPAVAEATPAPSAGPTGAPAAGPIPGPAARPEEPAAEPRPRGEEGERGPIRRIVVDAGHGGHDPGAIGPSRVREKDVTLGIARRLATRLRGAGFEVLLTRTGDRFLPLEERTAVANTSRADLFISIHANANPRRSFAGMTTYFLNVADDRYAARLAARENGLDAPEGETETLRILTDLDAKASAGASRQLAQLVQREVCAGVRERVGEVRDLGVKSALFYVLLGARMPAVLVETAHISNREEERRLASPRYQDEVAAGITRAVVAFARAGPRVAVAP